MHASISILKRGEKCLRLFVVVYKHASVTDKLHLHLCAYEQWWIKDFERRGFHCPRTF